MMDLAPYRLAVVGGDGLVARVGYLVMYVGDTGPSVAALLAALGAAAATDRPDQAIAQRLAGFAVGASAPGVPPFGVVCASADGLLVIVRGKVAAEVRDETGVRTLSGERAFAWVDEVFDSSVYSVAIGPALEPPPRPNSHADLQAGVVPGGGVVLQRRLASGAAEAPMSRRDAEPVTVVTSGAIVDATQVVGSVPANTSGPLWAAAALTGEDGALYPLDRRYVIGRDPLTDNAVRASGATPIVIRDDQHVSRAHAHVWVDDTAVWVRDCDTPAGTFIAAPGASGWTEIGTEAVALPTQWSLRIGEHTIFRHQRGAAAAGR